jgi:hypothetical protein
VFPVVGILNGKAFRKIFNMTGALMRQAASKRDRSIQAELESLKATESRSPFQ